MGVQQEDARIYEGRALQCIRFPLGGLSGRVNLTGRGALADWQLDGQPRTGPLPRTFAAIFAHAAGHPPVARILEARSFPPHDDAPSESGEGLPHMVSASFRGEFPFAHVEFEDPALPVRVTLDAFSPFSPGDIETSAFPAVVLRYTVANTSEARTRVTLAWSLLNIAGNMMGNTICASCRITLRSGETPFGSTPRVLNHN
jgi:uncharacterized protein (DUF608 family)